MVPVDSQLHRFLRLPYGPRSEAVFASGWRAGPLALGKRFLRADLLNKLRFKKPQPLATSDAVMVQDVKHDGRTLHILLHEGTEEQMLIFRMPSIIFVLVKKYGVKWDP